MISNCQDCNILSNSKQIRIHDAINTNFYINTISNPIIENSTKLIFHKYNLIFDELSELLQKININKDSTKWMEIMDFNWQNTQKLKDLIKDIETLKQSSIKNKNEKAYTPNEFNYDDNFLLPDDVYLFKEKEEVQVNENMIDLSQYNMSFQNMENKRIIKGFGETGCSNLLLDNLEKSPNFCINTEIQIYNIKIKYIKKFNGLHQEKLTDDNYVIENFPPFLKKIN
ncbi:hypothetical protein PFUGPA_01363 [Plasmodium falciparum Palo Alto/Uganda]|uniref:C-CAP/cofactor C-like domain-containing protein n=1 Tax=Plasmodium falciparum (isolate Palo Alto / Uganda) TaxID=57270 RepID=W4J2Q9_PLAFP|nr:hypothetical protein PFUGPA_01363 [Plasmodium falciparum Palo Alto/Uganda]